MRKISLMLLALSITGCSTTSPLPEDKYRELSSFGAGLEQCFKSGQITPKLYADTRGAFGYVLSTWSLDRDRLKAMADKVIEENGNPTPQQCRQVEANAYQMISITSERKQANQQNAAALNNSLNEMNRNKPIYCNKIGNTTICN